MKGGFPPKSPDRRCDPAGQQFRRPARTLRSSPAGAEPEHLGNVT
jgi:hypothetical protein